VQVARKTAGNDEHHLSLADDEDIVRRFDGLCAASERIGVACLAAAIISLSDEYRLEAGTMLELKFREVDIKKMHMNNVVLSLTMEAPWRPIYEFAFPLDRTIPFRALAPNPDHPEFLLKRVMVRGIVKSWPTPEPTQWPSIAEEVLYLSQIAASTVDKVCAAVDFPDTRQCGDALTEAVLRTVNFASPGFETQGVVLIFSPPDGSSVWRSTATWTGDPIPVKGQESLPAAETEQPEAGHSANRASAATIRSQGASSQLFHRDGVLLSDELRGMSGFRSLHATVHQATEGRRAEVEAAVLQELDLMTSGDIASFHDLHSRVSKDLRIDESLELRLKVDRGSFRVLDYHTDWTNVTLLHITQEALRMRLAKLIRIPIFVKQRYGVKSVLANLTVSVRTSKPRHSDTTCIGQVDAILAQCAATLTSNIEGRTFQNTKDFVTKCDSLLHHRRNKLTQDVEVDTISVNVKLLRSVGRSFGSRAEIPGATPALPDSNTREKGDLDTPQDNSGRTVAQSKIPRPEDVHIQPFPSPGNRTRWEWAGALPLVFEAHVTATYSRTDIVGQTRSSRTITPVHVTLLHHDAAIERRA